VQFTPDLLPGHSRSTIYACSRAGRVPAGADLQPISLLPTRSTGLRRSPAGARAMAERREHRRITHQLPSRHRVRPTTHRVGRHLPAAEGQLDRSRSGSELRYLTNTDEAVDGCASAGPRLGGPTVDRGRRRTRTPRDARIRRAGHVHEGRPASIVSPWRRQPQHPQVAVGSSPRAELDSSNWRARVLSSAGLRDPMSLRIGRAAMAPPQPASRDVGPAGRRSDVVEELLARRPGAEDARGDVIEVRTTTSSCDGALTARVAVATWPHWPSPGR